MIEIDGKKYVEMIKESKAELPKYLTQSKEDVIDNSIFLRGYLQLDDDIDYDYVQVQDWDDSDGNEDMVAALMKDTSSNSDSKSEEESSNRSESNLDGMSMSDLMESLKSEDKNLVKAEEHVKSFDQMAVQKTQNATKEELNKPQEQKMQEQKP